MHWPSRALGILLGTLGWLAPHSNGSDEECWGGDFNEELCCKPRWGLTGNPVCWDGDFSYLRCCGLDAFPRLPEEDARWDKIVWQRPVPPAKSPTDEYDYIIVGAGSAGSVIAARLATASTAGEAPSRVLLLEEGPWDKAEESPDPDSPPSDSSLWRPKLEARWSTDVVSSTWSYSTGRGLGGSAAINSMIYTRGSVSEYARFGWPAQLVLDAFKDLEGSMEVPGFAPNTNFHQLGSKHEMPGYHLTLVSATPEELPPLFTGLIAAFEVSGVPFRVDPHASTTIHGVGGVWRSMGCKHPRCQPTRVSRFRNAKGRPRSSPYTTLVAPLNATSGERLLVMPDATVERVVFSPDKEAMGVEVSQGGSSAAGGKEPRRRLYRATKEVILAAGAFGSPKILTLSGVAEPRELERLGIQVVASSPDVGRHLHEHVGLSIVVVTSVRCPEGYHRQAGGETTHLGDTADFIGQLYAFLNVTSNTPGAPGPVDVEIMLLEGCMDEWLSLTFTLILLQSQSTGRVVVQSRNPFASPHLDYTPLSHSNDLEVLANAVRFLYTKILPAEPLRQFELTASPPFDVVKNFLSLASWIRGNIYYYAHPTGTCRIQRAGASGVVDSRLRVIGTKKLRVADASVFPESPSGHTDGPSRLVGELAARFILGDGYWRAKPAGPSVKLQGYDGIHMPLLGLGTNGFEGELAQTSVLGFIRLGGRHIDTALLYNNHADIRVAIDACGMPRHEVFLVSKLPPSSMGFNEATAAIDRMIFEIGEYVDLLLIHWPANWNNNAELPACARPPGSWRFCRAETWRAMEQAYQEGKARALGVSNFGVRHLQELLSEPHRSMPVAANQVEFHPWWPQEELRRYCAAQGIALIAYGSLGGSLLGGAMLRAESVVQVAATRRKSPAQVLLRWAVQQGVAVIPSSSAEEHLAENLDVTDWKLNDDEMDLLNAVAPQDQLRIFLPDPESAP